MLHVPKNSTIKNCLSLQTAHTDFPTDTHWMFFYYGNTSSCVTPICWNQSCQPISFLPVVLGWCMWRLVAWRDWQILTIPHTKAPQKLGGWAAGWSIFSQLHYLLHRKVFSQKYIHMSVLLFITRGFSYTMNPTLFLLSCYCFTTGVMLLEYVQNVVWWHQAFTWK